MPRYIWHTDTIIPISVCTLNVYTQRMADEDAVLQFSEAKPKWMDSECLSECTVHLVILILFRFCKADGPDEAFKILKILSFVDRL